MLSYRFENIRLYKFPEGLYQQFRQIVLFGVLKKSPSSEENVYEYLKDAGAGKVTIPYLPETPEYVYEVPPSPNTNEVLLQNPRNQPSGA